MVSLSSPNKSLRSSRSSRSLSLITFPLDAFTSLTEEDSLLLRASGFEQQHQLIQIDAALAEAEDLLVDSVGRDQPVHNHRFGLPDSVAAVLSLQVCLGVLRPAERSVSTQRFQKQVYHTNDLLICTHPVTVEDDHGVSGRQVDPESSGSGAQQEEEHLRIFRELGHLEDDNKQPDEHKDYGGAPRSAELLVPKLTFSSRSEKDMLPSSRLYWKPRR
ncbi:hypothetical protein EYF80_041018 [Liparis tanakae]|uniref:Uncharacterized protein n=1 Tax=Liparis tanakae TaxID=230148 RepID=A0A4Z2G5H3_9TELE|nr:hypothetical protein EYF80_041018 [Liparis tanakae]